MSKLYVHAAVGRTGLGNMLVPWAWAEVFRQRHRAQMLAPQWTQPKIGPLLRRERDLRLYTGLFDNSGYVRGLKRLRILATAKRVGPEEFKGRAQDPGRALLVVHRFTSAGLSGLGPYRELLARRLREILRPRIRERLDRHPSVGPIVLHVRRGDRPPLPNRQPFSEDLTPGIPDEWFVGALRHLRELAGWEVPATVFSDAPAAAIRPVLELPYVALAPPNPSIVDMLLLARGSVLVGTGSSTFRAWAAMLGGMPTLYYPGLPERLDLDYAAVIRTGLDGRLATCEAEALGRRLRR